MDQRLGRLAALLASAALMAVACSSTTTTPSPAASTAAGASPGTSAAASAEASADTSVTPPPTAIPGNQSSAKPGQVEIRWYCCLGAGDAPEQVDGGAGGRRRVQRHATRTSSSRFEAVPYQAPRDALATEIASGNRPGHRGAGGHRRRQCLRRPVAGPGAAHREDRLRPEPVPAGRGRLLQARRPADRHPVRDLPVGRCGTSASLFEEIGLT